MKKEAGAFPGERNRTCASVEIPLRDDDSIDLLLDMAIVASDFCEDGIEPFPVTAGDYRLALAYREVHARIEPIEPRAFELTDWQTIPSWLTQVSLAALGAPAAAHGC
jgi:hypothetical protein